jgi:magnesium-transporting ATPase (P-type)
MEEEPTTVEQEPFQQQLEITNKPNIAGILLIIAGILAIVSWVSVITMDFSMIDITQLQEIDPTITEERVRELMTLCGIIMCILSVFPLLGGILSFKRKLWGIAVTGGILGLFTIGPFFASSLLSLIGLIVVVMSRKEFQ